MMKPLVLLVDDVPEMALLVAALGKRGGYEAASCSDVPSAWEYLGERLPDLILLDVHLPGGDGLELCRRARATPALADLLIALFGHWGRPSDIVAGLKAGVDFVVSKDLISQPAAWHQRLEEILPSAHGQRRTPLLGWRTEGDASELVLDWADALHRALAQACWRRLGDEVRRFVLQQALSRAFPGEHTDAWIHADGLALNTACVSRETQATLVTSLAEQMWRLLGTEASKPFRNALASIRA
jgi:CheY-like chemotaxis protein